MPMVNIDWWQQYKLFFMSWSLADQWSQQSVKLQEQKLKICLWPSVPSRRAWRGGEGPKLPRSHPFINVQNDHEGVYAVFVA
jgi:hypothetical protein